MSQLSDIDDAREHWSEDSSELFLELGDLFVPARAEQVETLLDLVPAQADETFTIVELGAGGGHLARAVLERFPHCRYVALDGSARMRAHLSQQLDEFRDRLDIQAFELAGARWRETLPSPLRAVLSSLCVHHLTGQEKQQLFRDLAPRLEPDGALLLADLVEPESLQAAKLFARQYDDIVRNQSLDQRGDLGGYEQFQELSWNYFLYGYGSAEPDPMDHPSPLYDQLRWLDEAGFSTASCYWMRAGHAIYGGYR